MDGHAQIINGRREGRSCENELQRGFLSYRGWIQGPTCFQHEGDLDRDTEERQPCQYWGWRLEQSRYTPRITRDHQKQRVMEGPSSGASGETMALLVS